jgi:hypothetical protein
MIDVATTPQCSVTLAELRDHHTVIDLVDYVDALLFIGAEG